MLHLLQYPWPTSLSDAPLDVAHLETERVTVVGEWGGLGFAAPVEHSWDAAAAEQGWGYAKYLTEHETTAELVKRTMEILVPMARERVVAAIWTQTTVTHQLPSALTILYDYQCPSTNFLSATESGAELRICVLCQDVEEEINGLLTYDREQKLNLELACEANRALVATASSVQMPTPAKM